MRHTFGNARLAMLPPTMSPSCQSAPSHPLYMFMNLVLVIELMPDAIAIFILPTIGKTLEYAESASSLATSSVARFLYLWEKHS